MVIKTGNKEVIREVTEEVEAGKIRRTETHNYLGMVVNEKGDLEDHLNKSSSYQFHSWHKLRQNWVT